MSVFNRVRPIAALACGLMLSASFALQAASFEEGKDYVTVAGITEAQKPVLREFFSYNCPHCYKQEPLMDLTVQLLGKDVAFERTPVGAGRPAWELSQLAYYVAQKLKMTKQTHGAIFKQIHEKGEQFTAPEQVKAFFVAQGAKVDDVNAAMNSVDAKFTLMNYDSQAELAGIKGVPSLLVNGRYMLTSTAHTPEELAALVKFLAAK
ncbi:thiol:disulfide interchange protein DsbA/DsbL [Shewanella baltica]|jgi:protein dithiol oxidoreductase (disulfide-forming)|uniref:thiol:disulfide interchange protein DsbA/DsbL n=1 Tax=Shewanella baltica TaxID=62322 RepID=UPI0001E1090B|nr:thiol:disulfide interchange protein DsbA/DsbL [Shewanella baltica]AEG10967.1 DSBA oxidoreductase [Shewanella baltica BA175]EHQ15503.1 DSBA oxidoreductase [Shewanella baltica OS183]MCS6176898.1 thiol:disulfide interchange protein DsbA/DsbL [Shewanella baltica]MCS6206742.1 thiol:disulfide interchange protein DsbA/DsbL [Shewanella baltica]SUI50993.1 Thiol:disulfide interchange protein DsbA precursor [Shewanella baltica]